MKMNTNTILLIVATLVVAGGAYWYFFTGLGNQVPLSSTDVTQSEAQSKFQALVTELAPVSFNTALLSDARFRSLVDLSTPVQPESAGRIDPFAPISGVSAQ